MEKITSKIRETARAALSGGEVEKVLGWQKGDFWYDSYPAFITKAEDVDKLVWDPFCVNSLSKYLIRELKTSKKIGVFLKECDALAFNQIVKDHRIERDKVVVYGVECRGMVDPEKVKAKGLSKGLYSVKRDGETLTLITKNSEKSVPCAGLLYEKCGSCRNPDPSVYNQFIGETVERTSDDRFKDVEDLEAMSEDERYSYWKSQFSKCIRCNACRNVCPACNCEKCIFDIPEAAVAGKAINDSEENFFHITRAYHVAGRCVDCGECSRVCPSGIPLHKLNRKIIKDINEVYGEYEAGFDHTQEAPLGVYDLEDFDPFEAKKGGK